MPHLMVIDKLALSFRKYIKNKLMQWCNRSYASTRFHFTIYNWGSSLQEQSVHFLLARKRSSFCADHLTTSEQHYSSNSSVSNRCLVGEPFIFSRRFMILPLEWLSESPYFHWTKPPIHSRVLIKFWECTCHLLRVLSVTLCGLHWPYVRLCMYISCRGKMQLSWKKSHTGLRLSVQVNKLIFNGWLELCMVNR